jgi:hypothetical protein
VLSPAQKKILENGIAAAKEMQQANAIMLEFLDRQIRKGIDLSVSEMLAKDPQEIEDTAQKMREAGLHQTASGLSRMPDERGGFITHLREEYAAKFGDPTRGVEGNIAVVLRELEKIQRTVTAEQSR